MSYDAAMMPDMQIRLVDSFDAYHRRIHQIPLLSAEEEHALAVRLHEHNDLEAAKKLVLSNLRFVAHLVRKSYSQHTIAPLDLVQEGNIGLMKAVRRFNPYAGVRLITFAVHWIKSAIHDYILNNVKVVKSATTKAQRKLFFNLKKMTNNLYLMTRSEAKDIAKALNVTLDDVLTMQKRLTAKYLPFSEEVQDDAGDGRTASASAVVAASASYEPEYEHVQADQADYMRQTIHKALFALDDRSRDIVQQRFLIASDEKKTSLAVLAKQYGISIERVRQVEAKAIALLRTRLSSLVEPC
jgi:RNA polymerase sigma-32 factor